MRKVGGFEIPLGARIFMVADVFDALTSDRSYHHATSYEDTCRILKEESGSHFDPAVVDAFLSVDRNQIEAISRKFRNHDCVLNIPH